MAESPIHLDASNHSTFNSLNKNLQIRASQIHQRDDIEMLAKILSKSLPQRSEQDRAFLTNFIEGNPFLNEITNKISYDFVKNMLNQGNIVQVKQGRLICQENHLNQYVGVILSGKLGLYHDNVDIGENHDKETLWESLIGQSEKHVKALQKSITIIKPSSKSKLRSLSFQSFGSIQIQQFENIAEKVEEFLNINQGFGFLDRISSYNYTQNIYTAEDSKIFLIKTDEMLILLEEQYRKKIKNLYYKLSKLSYFSFLQQQMLNSIIKAMTLCKKKRGNNIYSEGQATENIYFLETGQIKVCKQTKLLKQDPNQLYTNRKALLQSNYKKDNKQIPRQNRMMIERLIKKQKLPYANLETMYNYIPKTKMIELGKISPFSIFGEQQLVSDRPRETNVICESYCCSYYQLKMSKVQDIVGPKNYKTILEKFKQSLKGKVLNRQLNLSKALTIQNKANMNYFYMQNNKTIQSPLKFRIAKFNKIVKNQEQQGNSFRSLTFEKQKTPPTYTAFNFEKLVMKKNLDFDNKKKFYSIDQPNKQELDILNITHTWKLMKQKVDASRKTAYKISPHKHKITFKKPLFEQEYLQELEKNKNRIQVAEKRSIPFSLTPSINSSRKKITIHSPS